MYVYGFINEEVKRREQEKKDDTPPPREYGEKCLLVDRSATGCCLLAAVSQVVPTDLGHADRLARRQRRSVGTGRSCGESAS